MIEKANARGGGKGDSKSFNAFWEERTLPEKIILMIGFGILGLCLLALLGFIVMLLWNWLMPDIFGLKRLDYWQALGLMALCQILFKGFDFGDSNSGSDRKRKRELRRYMQEDQKSAGDDSTGSPNA